MCVYHYCSLEVFRAIIKREQIHLTNVRFMNDYAEMDGFLEIVRDLLPDKIQTAKTTGHNLLAEVYDELQTWMRCNFFEHVYCACFSKNSDELGQWRAYADDGCGVAIGFDREELCEANCDRLRWREVLYDEQKQQELAREALDFEVPPHASDARQNHIRSRQSKHLLKRILVHAAASCKSSAFASEEEVRLVYTPSLESSPLMHVRNPRPFIPDEMELDVNPKRHVLVPYLDAKAPRSAVRRIVRGPCFGGGRKSKEAKDAMEMFVNYLYDLDKGQGPRPHYEDSSITYRGAFAN